MDAAERFLLHFAAWNPSWKLRPVKRFVSQRSPSSLSLSFLPFSISFSLSRALRRSASALYASPPPPVVYSPNTQIFYAFSGQFVFTERTSSRSFGSNRKLRLFYRRGRKLFKTCCAQRSIGFSFVIESIIVIPLVSPLAYSS